MFVHCLLAKTTAGATHSDRWNNRISDSIVRWPIHARIFAAARHSETGRETKIRLSEPNSAV